MSSITSSGLAHDDEIVDHEVGLLHERCQLQEDSRIYEVFLSFTGEDMCASFISHLCASLQSAGITVFKDDESLRMGDQISDSSLLAIEQSRISIVVFSRNYAESGRCLKELEKITKCHKIGRHVMPVFYYVDPSEVRHQTGHFGNALKNLENRMLIDLNTSGDMEMPNNEINLIGKRWREALFEAAAIPGFVVLDSRHESTVINNVFENVKYFFNIPKLSIANYPVGVESRVQDIIHYLDIKQSNTRDVLILGMWGMGGIGKTTIAKAIYNKIGHNFEKRSFLRDVWRTDAIHLQKQLLFDIDKETEIYSIGSVKNILRKRLCGKRVLLILDGVSHFGQLEALSVDRNCLGRGSRIIITTRNLQALKAMEVDKVFEMKVMNRSESLELFSWHAFKQVRPREDFIELSRYVIKYSRGLPLTLEVLGSYFSSMEELIEWAFAVAKLNNSLNNLEISFEHLPHDEVREIFLEIIYFFIGMDKNDVIHILNGRGFCADIGIEILIKRALVTIDERNRLRMHDLIQELGWQITRGKVPNEPFVFIYDVFLSFRGKDTRLAFSSHLYASLVDAGISVFKDDESLSMGNDISDSLLRAIEKSQICIVVFSKNYAESQWCMKELEKIMECRRTIGKVVVPVFYDVYPSEVRHQMGHFGDAFQNLSNKILEKEPGWTVGYLRKVAGISSRVENLNARETETPNSLRNLILKSWREALHEAASISGFVVIDSRNENEAIKSIVQKVTHLLDRTELFIAKNPVGVESRVQDMIKLLDHKLSNDVLLLGIWGMGGIGKTTIAKAIYNKIGRNFEGRSFLAKIREVWGQDASQVHLQEQLLSDIYKEKETSIPNVESGKNTLKERLRHKKVLIVLDDVNELNQMDALCGSREWFGSGSRIIITTRDMDIIRGRRVDKRCTVEGMTDVEAMELFSWNAFKHPSPEKDFIELSKNVIAYSGRLPLALEVIGSYLFDMELTKWEDVLEKLKKIPNNKVHEKLKISFEGLNDDTEKDIFLDIAFFFIGMDRNDVIHILNGCGLFAKNGIRVLEERSLVTIDENNNLGMHDLLRDMGREVIRAKSPKEPEKRSRLCYPDEVLDVLTKESGTKAVEGLTLMLTSTDKKCLRTKAFKKMKRLRLLQLSDVQLDGDFKHFSKDLRWLCWRRFPLECLPTEFYQGSLVSIELENSNLNSLWKESQVMEKLKILNLSHSLYLIRTPNFSNIPNLENLILKDCPRLSKVSHTIGHLGKVVLINLEDCVSLCNLPRSIYKLKSLKILNLSGCLKIDKLEEDLEQMESLTTLIADKTGITKVPFSIVRSKNIGYISLCGFEGFSRDVFPSIIWSWMSPTNNSSCFVQSSYVGMPSHVAFNVPNNSSHDLLTISKELPKLRSLLVKCNPKLQLSQNKRIILDALYAATNSEEIESTTATSQVHISTSKSSFKSLLIQMGMNCRCSNILKENIIQEMTAGRCDSSLLIGNNYPDWLTFNCDGASVIFVVPEVNGHNLKTMMLIIDSFTPDNITSNGLKNVLVINHTESTIQLYKTDTLASFEDEEWQRLVSNIEPGNKVEVIVVLENGFIVKKTTVYLIYDDSIDKKLECCPASDKNVIVSGGDKNISAVGWISPQVESTNDFK